MKNTMVVVADLGGFKAYKLSSPDYTHNSPRLELLAQFDNPEAHGHLVDKVSDLSGRFPRGGGPGGQGSLADGERHNLELEQRKRYVRQMAQQLNRLAGNGDVDNLLLAASREINHALVEELDARVRAKIMKSVAADLTKLGQEQILRHF
jgi:protein required for attachment to host cells